jgi:hypothetical protein
MFQMPSFERRHRVGMKRHELPFTSVSSPVRIAFAFVVVMGGRRVALRAGIRG